MTGELKRLEQDQAIDQEPEYETRELLEQEMNFTPRIGDNCTVTEEQYRRKRWKITKPDRRHMRARNGTRSGPGAEDESKVADPLAGEKYDRGSDKHDPGLKGRQDNYTGNPDVGSMVAAGHGFNTWRLSTNPDVPEYCANPECGKQLLSASQEWPCEFSTPMTRCRCNGCTRRRIGDRKRGGQPRYCPNPECQKVREREKNERRRERDRKNALRAITENPDLLNVEIADLAEVSMIRVREARAIYTVNA